MSNPIRVYMMPTPVQAAADTTNSINQAVLKLAQYLPKVGVELVEDMRQADLVAGHAGQGSSDMVDVAHCHGLYPTAHAGALGWHWAANRSVIANLRSARQITVPSAWVGEMLERDMHVKPHVVGWAIEPDDWQPEAMHKAFLNASFKAPSASYTLWNKTRADAVCNPVYLNALASFAPDHLFVSTFGQPTSNVQIIGKQPYSVMRQWVYNAAVYLATTKETFGIGTLEAMASGVPVLGFKWGGTADIVEHGVTGYLVEPGDIEGLRRGLDYCLKHRAILGGNARYVAQQRDWLDVAHKLAHVYELALKPHVGPLVSVVIPLHNYGQYVTEAIESVQRQLTSFAIEIIVVDDGSTDGGGATAMMQLQRSNGTRALILKQENAGVAAARNKGIKAASGKYVVCLDADDRLGDPRFLQELAMALEADSTLGIVYTGLTFMTESGEVGSTGTWPHDFDLNAMLRGHNQVPTCCMFRRDAWERAGGYRGWFTPAEDAELWLRMVSLGFGAKQAVKAGWFHYRMHGQSLSSEVRQGKPEPDWRYLHQWINTHTPPFAMPTLNNGTSWAVRNYDEPTVSVIIPVGPGHLPYLREALDTVEAQTERFWEVIVVLDGCGDPTPAMLAAYPYVRWVYALGLEGAGKGAGSARNIGLKDARSPLVTFLDADDLLRPNYLATMLSAYEQTRARYVYSDFDALQPDGTVTPQAAGEWERLGEGDRLSVHAVNVLIGRDLALAVGGFDETLPAWEDVDFFLKLKGKGCCGERVPQALFTYRVGTGKRRQVAEQDEQRLVTLMRERLKAYSKEGQRQAHGTTLSA